MCARTHTHVQTQRATVPVEDEQHNTTPTDSILSYNLSPGIYSLKQRIKSGGRNHTSAHKKIEPNGFFNPQKRRRFAPMF